MCIRDRYTRTGAGERSGKKSKKREEFVEAPESREPELTAFQIAFQKAQDRADDKKGSAKNKKAKTNLKDEQEEIFSRTLENRITPG